MLACFFCSNFILRRMHPEFLVPLTSGWGGGVADPPKRPFLRSFDNIYEKDFWLCQVDGASLTQGFPQGGKGFPCLSLPHPFMPGRDPFLPNYAHNYGDEAGVWALL